MNNFIIKDLIWDIINIESEGIIALKSKIPNNIDEIIEILFQTKGKVVLTGMGKSGIIGKKIAATLSSTGTPSFFMHPAEATHGDIGMISPTDIILAISYSGETEELLKLIAFIKKQGNALISLTGNLSSTLAKNSNYCIDVSVEKEACSLQLAPTSSTTAALVMGDALAIVLSRKRGLSPEDFAIFHPGGNLGKRLLTTVGCVMKKENLPIALLNDNMQTVINTISQGRCGLVVVIEAEQIVGIITDGDLRRTIESKKRGFFNLKASEIMTRSPKRIEKTEKLFVAEEIMNKYKISSLLVTENGHLVGIHQIYDSL